MSPSHRRGRALLLFALTLLPAPATAGPQRGLELAIQHAMLVTDEVWEPAGFPVSGSITGTFAWPLGPRLRLTTGLGYEERWTESRAAASFFGVPVELDEETRASSLLFPLRFATPVGRHFEFEAGPELRWMLQTRARSTLSAAGSDQVLSEPWNDVTSAWDRSSLALAAAFAAHWVVRGGEARAGIRWCEALDAQRVDDFFDIGYRFRAWQVTLAWSR